MVGIANFSQLLVGCSFKVLSFSRSLSDNLSMESFLLCSCHLIIPKDDDDDESKDDEEVSEEDHLPPLRLLLLLLDLQLLCRLSHQKLMIKR